MAAGEVQFTPETTVRLANIMAQPEVAQTNVRLESARQKHQAKQSEAALEVLSGEVIPSTRQDDETLLLQRISSKRNTEGRKTNPTEAHERRWLSESRRVVEQVRQFLEEGTLNNTVVGQVKAFIEGNSPAYSQALREYAAVGGDVNEYVRNWINNNPSFKKQLRDIYVKLMDKEAFKGDEATVRDLESQITELTAKLTGTVTEAQVNAAQIEVDNSETELRRLRVDINEYQTNKATLNELASDITGARADVANTSLQARHAFIESQITAINAALGTLTPGTPDYSRAVNTLNTLQSDRDFLRYRQAQETVRKYDSARDYINRLTPNQRNVITSYERNSQRLEQLRSRLQTTDPAERAKIESELRQRQEDLADARAELIETKIKFFRDLTHMAGDAAEAYLKEAFPNLKQIYIETETEARTAEQELITNSRDKLSHFWKRRETDRKRNITSWTAERAQAQDVMTAYLNGGVDGVREYLMRRIMPGGTFNDAALRSRGFSQAEIDALRNQFKNEEGITEFFKGHGKSLGTEAIADYLVSGGRLTKDIVTAFATTDSGRELLESALSRSGEIREFISKHVGKDITSAMDNLKNTSKEFITKNWWKFALAILALLLALGIKGMVS